VRLSWFVKGTRTWLAVNGSPVFGPVPVSEPRPSGTIGFECRGPGLAVSAVAITPVFREGLVASSWTAIPVSRRAKVTEYFPAFPAVGRALTDIECRDTMSAAADGTAVWPLLATPTNGPAPAARMEAVAAELAAKNLRLFVKGFVLDAPSADWIAAVRAQGFKVMGRVKAGQVVSGTDAAMPDYLWLDETGPAAVKAAEAFLRRTPPTRLLVRDRAIVDRFAGVGWISEGEGEQKGRP